MTSNYAIKYCLLKISKKNPCPKLDKKGVNKKGSFISTTSYTYIYIHIYIYIHTHVYIFKQFFQHKENIFEKYSSYTEIKKGILP